MRRKIKLEILKKPGYDKSQKRKVKILARKMEVQG